jgi:glyoxylase-like metal-dependent hydrolase (beta-lactamase superfamily II)
MFDHPTLRARVRDGVFTPSAGEVLKLALPRLTVTEWWAAGSTVDLGGRRLEVVHVPGHAVESIAFLDRGRGQLFLGDFLYNDMLLVEDLDAYRRSTGTLIERTDGSEVLFGAHGAPRMPYSRLLGLDSLLDAVLDGRVALCPSIAGLAPQRRVVSGEFDLRLPVLGVKGILLPYLGAALAVMAVIVALYLKVSRVAAAVALVLASCAGYILHERM